MNQFVLVGRLTRDPELHQTQTGKMVTTITLAIRRNSKKENQEQADADFIPITAWGDRADLICKFLKKGNRVLVTGKLNQRVLEQNDGSKIYTIEAVAFHIEFLEKKSIDSDSASASEKAFGGDPFDNDDIPF